MTDATTGSEVLAHDAVQTSARGDLPDEVLAA